MEVDINEILSDIRDIEMELRYHHLDNYTYDAVQTLLGYVRKLIEEIEK